MANKKYDFTGDTLVIAHPHIRDHTVTLHRIVSKVDIPRYSVTAGTIGGWIESEKNLSPCGEAWVAENSMVFDDAVCMVNALTTGNAVLYGYAVHRGSSVLGGTAVQCGFSQTAGDSKIYEGKVVKGQIYETLNGVPIERPPRARPEY